MNDKLTSSMKPRTPSVLSNTVSPTPGTQYILKKYSILNVLLAGWGKGYNFYFLLYDLIY